jgi:hypothetical protein
MHPKSAPSSFLGEIFSYKRLPMGIACSPDIFHGKMSELMDSLEYVRSYLDDQLCISKLSLEDHLEILDKVLRELCNTGLKVNAAKINILCI